MMGTPIHSGKSITMNVRDIRALSLEEAERLKVKVEEVYLEEGRAGVARLFGVRYNSVGHLMQALMIDQRSLCNKRYAIRAMQPKFVNPFLVDSHTKYYTLGFILGDGSVVMKGPHNIRLSLSSSDKEFLEEFTKVFPGSKLYAASRGNYTISIQDYPICRWLLAYGFRPAKSFVGMDLPPVPDEYFGSFLLGLLDSDGCVLHRNKTSLVFEWVGHPSYMSQLYSRLLALGFNAKYHIRGRNSALGFVNIMSYSDACRVADLMYKDAPFCLKRKRDKVLQRYENLQYKKD